MSVAQIVAQHSSRYAQVIASLSEVENAPIALQEHRDLVFDVELQLKESQANVQQLSKKTQKEKRAAESPREIFSPRKLAQTFLGKKDIFKAASLDSKSAYMNALEDEVRERERRTRLEKMLSSVQQDHKNLSTKFDKYRTLKNELDGIHRSVFDGPTPGYPEEDQIEHQVNAAQAVHDRIQRTLESETCALEYLSAALITVQECEVKLKDALYWVNASTLGAGMSNKRDSKEDACLQSAHSLAKQVASLVDDARRSSSLVRSIGKMSLAEDPLVHDKHDPAFLEKITFTAEELARVHARLRTEHGGSTDRSLATKALLTQAAQTRDEYQIELDAIRKKIFLEIVDQLEREPQRLEDENFSAAPPSYDAPTQNYHKIPSASSVRSRSKPTIRSLPATPTLSSRSTASLVSPSSAASQRGPLPSWTSSPASSMSSLVSPSRALPVPTRSASIDDASPPFSPVAYATAMGFNQRSKSLRALRPLPRPPPPMPEML